MATELDILTGGTATASSEFGVGNEADTACDDNEDTLWASNNEVPSWWKYDLTSGVTKTVRKLRMYTQNSPDIKTFVLAGSNNDADWDSIYAGEKPNVAGWHEFIFTNTTAYRYHRLSMSDVWSGTYNSLREIELIEFIAHTQSLTETILHTDTPNKLTSRLLTDINALTDVVNKLPKKTLSDINTSIDVLTKFAKPVKTEITTLTDVKSTVADLHRTLTDLITHTDTVNKNTLLHALEEVTTLTELLLYWKHTLDEVSTFTAITSVVSEWIEQVDTNTEWVGKLE